jgi:hypothetical protein
MDNLMDLKNTNKYMKYNQLDALILLNWVLIVCAIFSCLIRNDINIAFGLIIIFILNRQYQLKKFFYSKILIHIIFFLIITDILWMFITFIFWNNEKNDDYENWNKLRHIRNFIKFLSYFELFMKILICYLLYMDFKNQTKSFKDLLNFNYNQ